jgi:hypothetical protein
MDRGILAGFHFDQLLLQFIQGHDTSITD